MFTNRLEGIINLRIETHYKKSPAQRGEIIFKINSLGYKTERGYRNGTFMSYCL